MSSITPMPSAVVSAVIINFSPASTENPTNPRPSTTTTPQLVVALVAVNLFVLALVAIVAFKIDTRRRRMNEAAAEKADLESQHHALPMAPIHAQQQQQHNYNSCPVPVYLPQVATPVISSCDYQSESNSYSTTDLSMQESPLHADYEYPHHHHEHHDDNDCDNDLEDETSLYSLTVSEMAEFFALSPPEVSDLTLLSAPIVADRVAQYHHVPLGVGLGITF
ncbi:hypothetical protein HDU78_001961 [Chytriomyces hyalinus]|nr:hypothetical protein HDU78_001961 [Chytriomyces hyalinus]